MEIQWRSSQIREGLTVIDSLISNDNIILDYREIQIRTDFYKANIIALISQRFALSLLCDEDIKLVVNSYDSIVNIIKSSYLNREKSLIEFRVVRNNVNRITTLLNTHSNVRNKAAEIANHYNILNLVIAISIVIISLLFWLKIFTLRQISKYNDHVRQFALLFSHMTVTRVNGLYLWAMDSLSPDKAPCAHRLSLARSRLKHLIDLTQWLEHIASPHEYITQPRRVSVSAIFEDRSLITMDVEVLRSGSNAAWNTSIPWHQTHLIIQELLANAQDALAFVIKPQIWIDISLQRNWRLARQLVISIRDNGQGMTSEQLSKAIKPFHSSKGEVSGHSGLGLFGCQAMVHNMDGQFCITSIPGEGTTVQIALPI